VMTVFHRRRNLEARDEHLYKKALPTKRKRQPGAGGRSLKENLRNRLFRMTAPTKKKMLPVDLDPRTMRWMKAKFEVVLGNQASVTQLELANAWLGSNDLIDVYAGSITEKKYGFVNALNRLEQWPGANRNTVSNWDEAVAFIELAMNLPADDENEPPVDDFIQRMQRLEMERDVPARTSVSRWNQIRNHFFPRATEVDDDMLLQERLEQAEAERNAQIEVEQQAAGYTIVPVSETDCQNIRNVMDGGFEDDVVAQIDSDTVQRRSFATLLPGQWLNDEVIHAYLQLLTCDKQHFFKSFFVTTLLNENVLGPKQGQYEYTNVKRWSKKVKGAFFLFLFNVFYPFVSHNNTNDNTKRQKTIGKDVFAMDKIFFPVNQGNAHWTLAVAYVQERRLQFYDSMGGSGRNYLQELERYFKDEHLDKKKAADTREWTLVPCKAETPRQRNVVDCGVFVCIFSEFLSRDRALTFSQDDIYICRDRIAHSLLTRTTAE
jgi:Ulp1 protease family, C-terminal catalytic domain